MNNINNEDKIKVWEFVVNGIKYEIEAETRFEAAQDLREQLNEQYNGR